MSLREDFRDIAFELAKNVKIEIDQIENKTKKTIEFLEEETKKKIQVDLVKLENTLKNQNIHELNIFKTEQTSDINQTIARKKNECIENFMKYLEKELVKKIKNSSKKYAKFLISKINIYSSAINSKIKLQLNETDLQSFIKNQYLKEIDIKPSLISLDKNPIETLGGFKIKSADNSFTIDYTFDALIEKSRQKITINMMKIFPIFKINIGSLEILE